MILAGVFMLVVTLAVQAQELTPDFFMGEWNVLVEGTPSGDTKMVMTIYQKDGQLAGEMSWTEGENSEKTTCNRVELEDNSITVYWVSNGYDVYLFLEKIEGDKLEGALMDMFDASAERKEDSEE